VHVAGYPKFYPVIYTAFAGTAGAQSIMFAKATLEMLVTAAQGQSSAWWLFTCLPPFALCLWCQVNFLNQALKLYDAMFVVPVYQTFWIVMGILSGLIFYQEYRNFNTTRTVGFIVGCLVNLVGIYIMGQRKNFAKHDTAVQQQAVTPIDGDGEDNMEQSLLDARGATPVRQRPYDIEDKGMPGATGQGAGAPQSLL